MHKRIMIDTTLTTKQQIETIDWSKSHNGVMLCTFDQAMRHMPEITPIVLDLFESGMLELSPENYLVDVKIHMLMPNMYPCIPNWHCDFLPRDKDGNRINEKPDKWLKMYEWVSGTPLTEFKRADGSTYHIKPMKWHAFDQRDIHRGTLSTKHQWRCFIRVIPKSFVHPSTKNVGTKRQHIQVYIPQPDKFKW